MKETDVSDFIQSLNAGVFAHQVGRALSDVAAGVVEHGKQGEVTVTFKIKRLGESHQVNVSHSVDYNQPTKRGKKREDITQDTPMHVTGQGIVLFPENPTTAMFNGEQAPVVARS